MWLAPKYLTGKICRDPESVNARRQARPWLGPVETSDQPDFVLHRAGDATEVAGPHEDVRIVDDKQVMGSLPLQLFKNGNFGISVRRLALENAHSRAVYSI